MSLDCCVALPRCAMPLSAVFVLFSDNTHLLFLKDLIQIAFWIILIVHLCKNAPYLEF